MTRPAKVSFIHRSLSRRTDDELFALLRLLDHQQREELLKHLLRGLPAQHPAPLRGPGITTSERGEQG